MSAKPRIWPPSSSRSSGDRARVVAGSFFDPLVAGADVYLQAQIVHDWPDDEAVAILRRAADAASAGAGPGGGRVVVRPGRAGAGRWRPVAAGGGRPRPGRVRECAWMT